MPNGSAYLDYGDGDRDSMYWSRSDRTGYIRDALRLTRRYLVMRIFYLSAVKDDGSAE